MHAAILGRPVKFVRWLLEQGADVTSRYSGYYWCVQRMEKSRCGDIGVVLS
ncbi:hypothetical protein [Halodesulfovibrio aestuarii]|uniref:hypothetical protein n=1 Tax=Halodesulfovibrio aestuarii TaxID=126333 RepID=UPI003D32159B